MNARKLWGETWKAAPTKEIALGPCLPTSSILLRTSGHERTKVMARRAGKVGLRFRDGLGSYCTVRAAK